MPDIFFDLDGTLLDSKRRLYQLFRFLLPSSTLTFKEYWDLKQNKISHEEILRTQFNYSDEQVNDFKQRWLQMIELPEWLRMDEPVKGVTEFLDSLTAYDLYVITSRQLKAAAIDQLTQLGLRRYFKDILVTEHRHDKADLIRNAARNTGGDWLVGDTGHDIELGKKLGMRTAAVLTGFLNRQKLSEYEPDVILDTVCDLGAYLHETPNG